MPVDASIYSMIRPQAQPAGPLEQYAQGLQIKHLIDSSDLNALQRQQLQESLQENAGVRAAFAGMQPGQTVKDILPQIYRASPKTGLATQKSLLESESTQADIDQKRITTQAAQMKAIRDIAAGVNSDADLPAARDAVARVVGPDRAAQLPFFNQPFSADAKMRAVSSADDFLKRSMPNYTPVNLGGSTVIAQTNPNAPGGATPASALKHTPTISDRIHAASADPFGTLGVKALVGDKSAGHGGMGAATPAGAQAAQSAATGDAYLQTLPKQMADQVKALAEGRMSFPGGFALKSPYWQQMVQMVSQYDPTFDAVNYNARAAVRKAFTSGNEAKSLNAANTVMGHMDEFEKAATALNNTDFPWVNKAYNTVVGGMSPDLKARLNRFNITKQAVVSELERAYRGTGGSQADIESWKQSLNDADSPEAIRASIQQGVKLLGSKIEALGEQYSKGMGTTKAGLELLTPKAKATYERLSGEGLPGQTSEGKITQTPSAGPTRAEIEAELRRRKIIK